MFSRTIYIRLYSLLNIENMILGRHVRSIINYGV